MAGGWKRRRDMKKTMPALRSIGVLCLSLVFAAGIRAQQPQKVRAGDNGAPTIITFDAPCAGTGAGLGTWALGINTAGVIAGYCYDGISMVQGFVRAADGTVTSFGPPGGTIDELAVAINAAGTVTGSYADARGPTHGFVRTADGAFTSFDVPDAGTFFPQGTYSVSINEVGALTGYYIDEMGGGNGFVRAASGAITILNPPGIPASINAGGAIAGYYGDSHDRARKDAARPLLVAPSPDTTATRTTCITDLCALPMASSPVSTLPARAPWPARGHTPRA
jgi:hypothetical protein